MIKARERAKIRNGYNQAPHLIQDTNGKVTTSQLDITNERQEASPFPAGNHKALINSQAPHLIQDTNGKVTTSQLDITNESQEASPFPAGDHNTSINRRARKHNKVITEIM